MLFLNVSAIEEEGIMSLLNVGNGLSSVVSQCCRNLKAYNVRRRFLENTGLY
jgi:hypothetical protein